MFNKYHENLIKCPKLLETHSFELKTILSFKLVNTISHNYDVTLLNE